MKKTLTSLCLIFLIFGCSVDERSPLNKPNEQAKNFVNWELAKKIAEIQAPNSSNPNARTTSTARRISSKIDYLSGRTQPSLYLVSYEGGGFSIISADNRFFPVLAYSEAGNLYGDFKNFPPAMIDWLNQTSEMIRKADTDSLQQEPWIKNLWADFENSNGSLNFSEKNSRTQNVPCSYEGQVTTESQTYEIPTLAWHQDAPFNNTIAYAGCSSTANGKYPTGCVATAIGIVMQYHKKTGTIYNWAAMETNPGHADVAKLMRNLGLPANLSMSYDCSGSGANTWTRLIPTFQNFGWPSPSKSSGTNPTAIKNDIKINRPVIMTGRRSSGGHAWVVDGFKSWQNYQCHWDIIDSEWQLQPTSENMHVRINWGWGTSGNWNGWYYLSNYTPSGQSSGYNTDNETFYNIRPY